jgi:hypothetical protein
LRRYLLSNGCTTELLFGLIETLIPLLKVPKIISRLNHLKAAVEGFRAGVDVGGHLAQHNFVQLVEDAIGITGLPISCIKAVTDITTGGQFTAFELCIADAYCTDLMRQQLGLR